MPKQIIIAEQHRTAAVFSEDQIQELIVATGSHQVGDIYVGTVENVLSGIDAAFINIGDSERNGFMHVSDLGPLKLKRAPGPITELVAPKQKVLVQIMKEPTGNKGPRLTGKITLPGRYLVLMPYGRGVNLSRRIRNEAERHRLRALGILTKPPGMGLLVRTEAEGVSEEAIIEDLEALQKRWEMIQQEAMATRPPALLNRDDDFIQRVLRDVYNADVNRIVTDSDIGMQRVKQHLSSWSDGRLPAGVLVDHHRTESPPILEYFRVNAAIREALKPRVDLPSGGYIIIEPTEALTVIDVNSGSFTRSATARETVLWTNCEAAVEIARQLRLRNVAGVIVIDFIDMESRRDQMQVLEHFGKALQADKARPQISQLSELGLVELTRKRQGQNIYELFSCPCTACGGLGHLAQLPGEAPVEVQQSAVASRVVPMPSVRMARQERSDSLEPEQNLKSLDLVNHPDYHDKGNGRSSRRRRRRGNDSPSSTRSGRSITTPPKLVNNGSNVSSIVGSAPILATNGDSSRDELSTTETTSTRGKRSRGRGRKPEVPPQVVTVALTPNEQRIYAEMGISPLVLSQEEIQDTKNVVVSVVLPGETSTSVDSSQLQPEHFDTMLVKSLGSEETQTDMTSVSAEVTDSISTDAPLSTPDQSDVVPEDITEASQNSPESEEPETPPTRRRRRRRSSATVG
ncbi:Rne/Rng family ribonuclease [Leptolyngbyaceae cyanobacterium CCMR0082]|uniref:Rne/Rng family ribonuclease n=2 Tax=Adonisia turfae TaxID=2950184 RepID=A0A6M0S3G1_9CYAN|nr:Rne/Rng family ribonuclease [Adonisia turfae]MDV3349425.1 Rne/Rng family ribonuclease [Leptothoe sp. LEGE 181152]NEZ54896.1 Rne/Rng family ribonuclease [Adonisia turfae CCMR0081]NEZ62840.1 Rne/Rng family ribonuclease [Adonisia turfae CCMR0082]